MVARSDADRVGELVEVGELGGGGVKALPQQRERLHAVEQVGLDPGAGERRLDLPGQLQALDRGWWCAAQLVLPRARLAAWRSCSRGVSAAGWIGDRDPPAGGDGGLLGAGGRDHGLCQTGQEPPARRGELTVAGGGVLLARAC